MPRQHALAERPSSKAALENLEKVVITGDLSQLTQAERIGYYARVCQSLGLNPLTRPFDYITLNGKLTLYARRDATDQLRKVNGISVTSIRRDSDPELGLQVVTVEGRDRHGRIDSSIGVVSTKGLTGETLANALMKAETKGKRRMTLSLAGLGWLDETEVDPIEQGSAPVERQSLIEALEARAEELTPQQEVEPATDETPPAAPDEAQQEAASGEVAQSTRDRVQP
jgi:hypothetical protein